MKSFNRFKLALVLGLIGYACIGLASLATPKSEIFPFYSWFLFASVPGQEKKYGLLIISVNGRSLPTPQLFEEAGDWVQISHSVNAQKVIQMMGLALRKNDLKLFEESRAILESRFLRSSTEYRLVKLRYAPLERFKNRSVNLNDVCYTRKCSP